MVVIVSQHQHKQHGNGVLITGDTYDIKELLRNYGGAWNAAPKGWFFSREKEILDALAREQLLVQDNRPTASAPSQRANTCAASSGGLVWTPAPVRGRMRSRTPPRVKKASKPALPEVRLNERTVRERSAALGASARAGAMVDPIQAALAGRLVEKLRVSVAAALAASSDDVTLAQVEEVLAAADSLDPMLLESVGLAREASRLSFQRGAGAAGLRAAARRACRRWLGRRVEAAAEAEPEFTEAEMTNGGA